MARAEITVHMADVPVVKARIAELVAENQRLRAEVDAAEARGRAELVAKVRELADEWEGATDWNPWPRTFASHLRALIADDTARTTDSRGPTTATDAPPPV